MTTETKPTARPSSTATSAKAKRLTAQRGPWFDGYEECKR